MSSSLVQDWKFPRTAKGFTATLPGQRVQSTVLRCVTNNRIPCTAKELASMGKTRFTVTVLGISGGYAYAPFKKAQPGKKVAKDPNAKPLFEEVHGNGAVSAIKLYSYKKAKSNFDRDERDDSLVSTVSVGQVISFFVQPFMYEAKESKSGQETRSEYIFPNHIDFIPEFTVIDMRVTIGNNQTEGGYGLKLQKVTLHDTTLYSYFGPESLLQLPSTDAQAKELGEQWQTQNPFISSNLESSYVAFFAQAPDNAYISSSPVADGYYRVVGANGSELFPGVPCLDVSQSDLLRFANKPGSTQEDVLDAITLLDFASSASALYLYVVSTRTFKNDIGLSDYRGVPLVDANRFLSCVSFEEGEELEGEATFPLNFSIAGLEKPFATVSVAPLSLDAAPAPCPDFSLLSEDCTVSKGYFLTIGTDAAPDILRLVFNVMGCQSQSSHQRLDYLQRAQRKRKALPAEEA